MSKQQTMDELVAEERSLELLRFNCDDAWWLGSRLHTMAEDRKAPVAIEIEKGGTTLFLSMMPGANRDNQGWLRRKIAVVRRFERSSYAMHLKFSGSDALLSRFGLDPREYAMSGGALPITIRGSGLVGVAAMSGLTQEDDHRLVRDALMELQARQKAQPEAIS